MDACFIVRSQSVHRIQESQALLGYQLWLAVQERLAAIKVWGRHDDKPAGDYLSSGPRFGEGDVIERIESFRRRRPRLLDDHVTLAHGAGGKASAALVDAVFLEAFRNPMLESLGDGAVLHPAQR